MVADQVIGTGRKRSPDWFQEKSELLTHRVQLKNQAQYKYLRQVTRASRRRFLACQRAVQKAVRVAKSDWTESVASAAVSVAASGCTIWDSVEKLQSLHAGRRPARATAVYMEDGFLSDGPTRTGACVRWLRHFSGVLNVVSDFDDSVLDNLPARPVMVELDGAPTTEELEKALKCMRMGKAGGSSGILPELIHCGGSVLRSRILYLMGQVWSRLAASLQNGVMRSWYQFPRRVI